MIDHGESVLNGIRIQNDSLKNIKRKIFNVTNALGLSNTLMRMIERRSTSDKYILYGGMVITCIIMLLVVRYLI
jgi:Golgi SNAP receptor complex protein 2